MPQSLVKNYIHIVFSTKHRQLLISPPFENKIHCYLAGTCKRLECNPIIAGGHTDHVHILCLLSKKISLVGLMTEFIGTFTEVDQNKDESLKNFYWQDGYGAFSINPSEVDIVSSYIKNHHEHHRKKSFQDEKSHFSKTI